MNKTNKNTTDKHKHAPPADDPSWPQMIAAPQSLSDNFKRSSNTRTKQQTQTHQYGPAQIVPIVTYCKILSNCLKTLEIAQLETYLVFVLTKCKQQRQTTTCFLLVITTSLAKHMHNALACLSKAAEDQAPKDHYSGSEVQLLQNTCYGSCILDCLVPEYDLKISCWFKIIAQRLMATMKMVITKCWQL